MSCLTKTSNLACEVPPSGVAMLYAGVACLVRAPTSPAPVRAGVSRRAPAARAVLAGEASAIAVIDPGNLDPRFYDLRDALFIETLARTAPLAHRSVLPRALTASLISSSEQRGVTVCTEGLSGGDSGVFALLSRLDR